MKEGVEYFAMLYAFPFCLAGRKSEKEVLLE